MTNLATFKESRLVANNLKDNKDYMYSVSYGKIYGEGNFDSYYLDDKILNKIKEITGSKLNIGYDLNDGENVLEFEWGEDIRNANDNNKYGLHGYYNFIEVEDDRIFDNIIGSKPKNKNELVIHKHLAECIIRFGVKDRNNEIFKPKDFNELVNSRKEIKMGENNVIITGIMDDDNRVFLSYLNNQLSEEDNNLLYGYTGLSYRIYVKSFTDYAKLNDKPNLLEKTYASVRLSELDDYTLENLKILDEPITVITTNGEEEISKLNKDEIIINLDCLEAIDKKFDSSLTEYMNNNKDGIYSDLLNKFLKEYFSNNPRLLMPKVNQLLKDNDDGEGRYATIKGVSLDNNTYISKSYIDDYKYERKYIRRVFIYDNSVSHMIKSFDKMVYDTEDPNLSGEHYVYSTSHDRELEYVISIYKYLKVFIFIVTCVFVLFMFLLFSNFVGLSISANKKEIGILRAIGASNGDIVKIYGYESIILGVLSWLFSLVGYYLLCNYVNDFLGTSEYYILNVVVLNPLTIIIMLVFVVCIAIIISSSYINKISKIKPIDVILNRE